VKKNTKTYLLIAAALGIWGTIGYQVINGINPNAPEVIQENVAIAFNPKTAIVRDTFSIQSVERDPFLGTLTSKRNQKKPRPINKKVEDTSWMDITYQGLVRQKNSEYKVFVVTLNGEQHLLKKGQKVNNYTLLNGNNSEVLIRYNNIKKTIAKQ